MMPNKGGRGHSAIAEAGLEDVITRELLEGLGTRAIAKRHGLGRGAVRSFAETIKTRPSIETHPTPQDDKAALPNPPAKATNPAFTRNQELVALTAEVARLKLGTLLQHCESNYLEAKEQGDEALAGSWAREWANAIDKLLRATGVYARALDQPTPEPVHITIRTVCKQCGREDPEGFFDSEADRSAPGDERGL